MTLILGSELYVREIEISGHLRNSMNARLSRHPNKPFEYLYSQFDFVKYPVALMTSTIYAVYTLHLGQAVKL